MQRKSVLNRIEIKRITEGQIVGSYLISIKS